MNHWLGIGIAARNFPFDIKDGDRQRCNRSEGIEIDSSCFRSRVCLNIDFAVDGPDLSVRIFLFLLLS